MTKPWSPPFEVFVDARKFQGLLGRAVQQLVVNWENTMGVRAPQKTWMGALLLKMNKVWPRFRVHIHSGISWTGAPLLRQETRFSLSRQFQEDLSVGKWQVRQSALLNSRPRESQHDFFLFIQFKYLVVTGFAEKFHRTSRFWLPKHWNLRFSEIAHRKHRIF